MICSTRLVRLDPEFYVRNRTGDLMSRATNDLNAVRMVLGPGIMYTRDDDCDDRWSRFFSW